MRLHVCMFACLHVYMSACKYIWCMHAGMHACACAWMHVPIWETALCANVSVQAYVCKCIRICNMRKCCICVCVRACVYAYDHVCSEGVLTGRPQLRGSCPKVYSLASRTTSLCTPKACQTWCARVEKDIHYQRKLGSNTSELRMTFTWWNWLWWRVVHHITIQ